MLDVSKIQSSLLGLIGYKQPFNPDYAIIDADNLLSDSGYFVNSNPYAKIEYIKDCQDYKDISNTDFNKVLEEIKTNSISNVTNQVFNESSYIDRNLVYKNAFNKVETESLPNGFVGYRIRVSSEKSIAFNITRLFLDFEGTGDITVYLFNSAQKTPIKTQLISITSDHQEYPLNWVINDTDGVYKGEYYLGYIKTGSDTFSPYKRDYNDGNVMSYITYLDIDLINVDGVTTPVLFDLNEVSGMSESVGLNPDITVYDDYTDLIIQNKSLFARAIYLSAVISCLRIYMASLRSSRNEKLASDLYNKVLVEIEGTKAADNVISVKGLRSQMLSEISTIKDAVQSIKEGYLGNGYDVITLC